MAYSTPTSRSDGYIVPASVWNSDVVDNVVAIAEERPAVYAYTTSATSVANAGSGTALSYGAERYDIGGCWDGTNATKLICPTGGDGLYAVGGYASFAANTGGGRRCRILLNATTVLSSSWLTSNQAGSALTEMPISTDVELSAGDFVTLVCYQTSGGALDTNGALWWKKFSEY